MSSLQRAKQIKKIQSTVVAILAQSINATQFNGASQLNSAINAINDYSPLDVEQSKMSAGTTDTGLIPNSRVIIRTTANKRPLSVGVVTDAADALNGQLIAGELFGEIAVAFGVVTFYIETVDGQKHIVTLNQTVDLFFVYRFDFKDFPVDGDILLWGHSYQDPANLQGRLVAEVRNVTALNTVQNLSFQANSSAPLFISVNGKMEVLRVAGKFTVGGTGVTARKEVIWLPYSPTTNPNSYDLETSDEVVAIYFTFE